MKTRKFKSLIKASCAPGMKTAFGTEDVPAEVALKQG